MGIVHAPESVKRQGGRQSTSEPGTAKQGEVYVGTDILQIMEDPCPRNFTPPVGGGECTKQLYKVAMNIT